MEEGTAPCLAIAVRALYESSLWKSGRHIHPPPRFCIFNFSKGQYSCSTSHAILYIHTHAHTYICTCLHAVPSSIESRPSDPSVSTLHLLFYFTHFLTYGTAVACEWSERFRPSECHLAARIESTKKYPFEQEPHLNAGGRGPSPSPPRSPPPVLA